MNGEEERAEAKRWAAINAIRMGTSLTVVATPDGNVVAHLGFLRGWIARRPVMFLLTFTAAAAWLTRAFHGIPL